MSNYPNGYTGKRHDAAQGRDDAPEHPAEDCYEAARDFLFALDRGFFTMNHMGASYVTAMRDAVAAETDRRVADAAELRAACETLRILGRVG